MSDPIKMYGPYKHVEDAVKAGFKKIMLNSQWEVIEYAFWVAFKQNPDKSFSYCFTEPEQGSSTQSSLQAPPGIVVRAFCHTHPETRWRLDFWLGRPAA